MLYDPFAHMCVRFFSAVVTIKASEFGFKMASECVGVIVKDTVTFQRIKNGLRKRLLDRHALEQAEHNFNRALVKHWRTAIACLRTEYASAKRCLQLCWKGSQRLSKPNMPILVTQFGSVLLPPKKARVVTDFLRSGRERDREKASRYDVLGLFQQASVLYAQGQLDAARFGWEQCLGVH